MMRRDHIMNVPAREAGMRAINGPYTLQKLVIASEAKQSSYRKSLKNGLLRRLRLLAMTEKGVLEVSSRISYGPGVPRNHRELWRMRR